MHPLKNVTNLFCFDILLFKQIYGARPILFANLKDCQLKKISINVVILEIIDRKGY